MDKIETILATLVERTERNQLVWYKVKDSYVTFIKEFTITLGYIQGRIMIDFKYRTFDNVYYPDFFKYKKYLDRLWALLYDCGYKPRIDDEDFLNLVTETIAIDEN
jgi:hypothetical protein